MGTASDCKFIPSLAASASPVPKYRSISLSTAASRSTTATLGSSIPTLPEGDIFTLLQQASLVCGGESGADAPDRDLAKIAVALCVIERRETQMLCGDGGE